MENLGGLQIDAITGNQNIKLLEEQYYRFHPLLIAVYDEKNALVLRDRLKAEPVRGVGGMDGLMEAAAMKESDTVVTSVVGNVGLAPTFAAIEAGKDIALANKETLVSAGELVMNLVKKKGVHLYPVDSEHSAIFQSLRGNEGNAIRRILLTASGGPSVERKEKN